MAVQEKTRERTANLTLEQFLELRRPTDVAVSPDGSHVAFSVGAAYANKDERPKGQIWTGTLEGGCEPATRLRRRTSSGRRGRWNTNVWQRERTVGSTFERSVVQNTKTRCGGGSSISFSSAFHAASVNWCASSRMYTL